MTKLDLLISTMKQAMKQYDEEAKKIMDENDSSFGKYKKYLTLLEEDINNITDMTQEELAEILSEIDLSEEDRETEFNYLRSVISLLNLNKTKNTTYQLSERQKLYLESLKHQLFILDEETKKLSKDNLEKASLLTKKIRSIKHIIGMIEDSKNKDYIDQTDLLEEIIKDVELTEEEQREVLYSVLKYNQDLYVEKMQGEIVIERPRLNIEDVKDLLSRYNYRYEDLKENLQEDLLAYGNLNQMEEVLEALKELKFPKIDLSRNAPKLVALLVNGNKDVMEDVVGFARENGIYPKTLLGILPVLIEQNKKNNTPNEGTIVEGKTPYITGRSEDFKNNVNFFKELGFDIDFILKKCKETLLVPNEKLKDNYRKFVLYGFTIATDQYGDLCHPALSCLIASNFEEIVDQFIEVSRDGHQYIKENMSRIMTTTSPHDILFYNMIASNMNQDENGEYMVPEGPFSGANHKKLKLRGEITRYAGSGYENIPYRGITEENKRQKTFTVDVELENKDVFDQAVQTYKKKDGELYDLVFNDQRVLALEEYVDISDPQRYDFDGVLISKQKFMRILNYLKNAGVDNLNDSVLYALTYNSILTEEALNKIIRVLRTRRK